MLSVFPFLFSYALVVPFVFRIVSGLTFVAFGYAHSAKGRVATTESLGKAGLKSSGWLWALSALEIIGGIALVIGLWTQVASLVLSVILLLGLIIKYKNKDCLPTALGFLFLLLLITSSLLFLGPGFYSLDLPL